MSPEQPQFPDWTAPGTSQIPQDWLSQVYAYLLQHPLPGASSPALAAVKPVVGAVNADGTINRGAGFTAVRATAGTYTVTFTQPFSVAPCVLANVLDGSSRIAVPQSVTAASFTVITRDSISGTLNDRPFSFRAEPPSS